MHDDERVPPPDPCWARARDHIVHAAFLEIRSLSRQGGASTALLSDDEAFARINRLADLAHTLPTLVEVRREDLVFLSGELDDLGAAGSALATLLSSGRR